MGWSIGYDTNWDRDIGYGVPAYCDYPTCTAEIDRGLAYVCGGGPYGGEYGCGLYFCEKHLHWKQFFGPEYYRVCKRCKRGDDPYPKKADHPDWLNHKATDPSWAKWREEQAAIHVR